MICAVVATRNEAATIGPLLRQLRGYVNQVVVVDESTTPSTAWVAESYGAHVSRSLKRTGIGPSTMRGWHEALRLGADKVVQIDAGGSHNPSDLPLLLTLSADITIGSRFLPLSEYVGRPWRATASRAYGYSMYARSGLPVRDWTSGFRVFTAEAIEDLLHFNYSCTMHGWQAEVLLRAHNLGLDIAEVPIRYQAGDSSLRLPHVWEALTVK